MLLHSALEHLGDCQVPLLVDIDQHQKLQIPPGPPGIPARSVIEKVESVVTPGYQIWQEQQTCCHIGAEKLTCPTGGQECVEDDPGVHHTDHCITSSVCKEVFYSGDTRLYWHSLYWPSVAGPGQDTSIAAPGQWPEARASPGPALTTADVPCVHVTPSMMQR